jgi:hypothetical protein
MMSDGPQAAAFDALTELVNPARMHRDASLLNGRPGWAQTWDILAGHLDRSRTRLVEEGDDYLADAWGTVDAGRLTIARHLIRIDRRTAR